MFSFFTCSASIMIKALLRQCLPCSQSQLKSCCIQLWKLWIGEIMCMYPVRKLLSIFFAIAIVTNSDSGKHWKHTFQRSVLRQDAWLPGWQWRGRARNSTPCKRTWPCAWARNQKPPEWPDPCNKLVFFGDVVYPRVGFQFASKWSVET